MRGALYDSVKIGCSAVWSSKLLQKDWEKLQLFGDCSPCELPAVGTLLDVHVGLETGPKWICAYGSKATVRPFLDFL